MVTTAPRRPAALPSNRAPATGAPFGERVTRREGLTVYAIVGSLALAEAVWLAFVVRIALGDALSRSEAALEATRSAHPHLAAIGFIWPPLPVLLQLPLMLIPLFRSYGFGGGVVSALFAGPTAVVACLILARAGLRSWQRWLALALFLANPLLAFYFANGMSEAPFIFAFLLTVYAFQRWAESGRHRWLIGASFGTVIMLMSRYDGAPFALVFGGAIVLLRLRSGGRFDPARLEANLLIYGAPVTYVAALWLFFNWQFLGDPLYFLHSEYSNSFLVSGGDVARPHGSLLVVSRYVIRMTLALAPVLALTIPLLVVNALRRRSAALFALLALLLVIPLAQALLYEHGQTFGFIRFFISLIGAGLISGCELVRRAAGSGALARRGAVALLVGGLLLGDLTSASALRHGPSPPAGQSCGSTDRTYIEALRHPRRVVDGCRAEREMARFILDTVAERSILTDITGKNTVLFSGRPSLFYLLSDPDYDAAAREPAGRATALLTNRAESAEYRALERYYPGLRSEAPPGLTLLHAVGALRLYRLDAP